MSPAQRLSHVDLQAHVIDLAHHLGWKHLHARRSIGKGRAWTTALNVKGFPDLLLWSTRQTGRHIAIEVKVATKLTPEQASVLAELAASGFECMVVTEADLEDLAKVLRPDGRAPAGSALSSFIAPDERTAP